MYLNIGKSKRYIFAGDYFYNKYIHVHNVFERCYLLYTCILIKKLRSSTGQLETTNVSVYKNVSILKFQ